MPHLPGSGSGYSTHAQYIVDRFNALYPWYHGTFAARVVCDDAYDLVSVRLKKEYVERYKNEKAYVNLSETAKRELVIQIAPLVVSMEKDSTAKRFDNFAYGLIIAGMERMTTYPHAIQQLKNICELLQRQVTIPQIKAKIDVIKAVQSDEFWQQDDLFYQVELARRDLRGLIQFLVGGGGKPRPIYTNIADPVIKEEEGVTVDKGYDFEDYKKKVNRYIGEHGNATAIYKLTHNKPLYQSDFDELQHIFTVELGKREDYEREYGDTPFGILVRKVGKLDHDAAMEAFSQFIGNEQLSQQQIQFVHKVITYIENNGYMDDMGDLMKAPFDRPVGFIKLFDFKTRTAILDAINAVNDNATKVVVG